MKGSRADKDRTARPANAKSYAFKLLSYRARSRKEMLDKLKRKGFDSREVENTVSFLENAGLINDRALADDLFKYSTGKMKLGKKGIRMFLVKRGIDREIIDNALSEHTPEMEERSALDFIEKKMRSLHGYPEHVIRRRLWGMLQRRGFSGEVMNKVLKQ